MKLLPIKLTSVPHIGMVLTSACNLNCRGCADLVPYRPMAYYKKEDVISDLSKILEVIETIGEVLLIGGETLLYKDLHELLAWCLAQKQIQRTIITTNGTLFPSEALWKALKHPKAVLRISGYGPHAAPRREELIYQVQLRGIQCENLQGMQWLDIGDNQKRNRSEQELRGVFHNCPMSQCVGVAPDGKMFWCSRSFNAYYTDDYPSPPASDIVDVRKLEGLALQQELLRFFHTEYLSTCDYCDGIHAFSEPIETARQILPKSVFTKLLKIVLSLCMVPKEDTNAQLGRLTDFVQILQESAIFIGNLPEYVNLLKIIALCEYRDGALWYMDAPLDVYDSCGSVIRKLCRDYRFTFSTDSEDCLPECAKPVNRRNYIHIAVNNEGKEESVDLTISQQEVPILKKILEESHWVRYPFCMDGSEELNRKV